MNNTPLDTVPAHNRISVRAVLVHEGEDPSAALAAAGLVNAISVPVVLGEAWDPPAGVLGNGITPNLSAVLEMSPADSFGAAPVTQSVPAVSGSGSGSGTTPAPGPVARTLPAAFGTQPLAPVRQPGG